MRRAGSISGTWMTLLVPVRTTLRQGLRHAFSRKERVGNGATDTHATARLGSISVTLSFKLEKPP